MEAELSSVCITSCITNTVIRREIISPIVRSNLLLTSSITITVPVKLDLELIQAVQVRITRRLSCTHWESYRPIIVTIGMDILVNRAENNLVAVEDLRLPDKLRIWSVNTIRLPGHIVTAIRSWNNLLYFIVHWRTMHVWRASKSGDGVCLGACLLRCSVSWLQSNIWGSSGCGGC